MDVNYYDCTVDGKQMTKEQMFEDVFDGLTWKKDERLKRLSKITKEHVKSCYMLYVNKYLDEDMSKEQLIKLKMYIISCMVGIC